MAPERALREKAQEKLCVPLHYTKKRKVSKAPLLRKSALARQPNDKRERQNTGERLVKRIAEKEFPYPYKCTCFAHMSHMMMEYCGTEIRHFIKSEKQYPEECAKERKQMGAETPEWVEGVWE